MEKPTVYLLGKDGNAFAILAQCQYESKKLGWTIEQWITFRDEAISGDYDHLLQTVMNYFEVE